MTLTPHRPNSATVHAFHVYDIEQDFYVKGARELWRRQKLNYDRLDYDGSVRTKPLCTCWRWGRIQVACYFMVHDPPLHILRYTVKLLNARMSSKLQIILTFCLLINLSCKLQHLPKNYLTSNSKTFHDSNLQWLQSEFTSVIIRPTPSREGGIFAKWIRKNVNVTLAASYPTWFKAVSSNPNLCASFIAPVPCRTFTPRRWIFFHLSRSRTSGTTTSVTRKGLNTNKMYFFFERSVSYLVLKLTTQQALQGTKISLNIFPPSDLKTNPRGEQC